MSQQQPEMNMSRTPLAPKPMLPPAQNNPLTPKRLLRVQQQELIVINSDSECDSECEGETNYGDQSVYIVDMDVEKENVPEQSPKVVDEDLIITFSQRANVLPHARYDCPVHPFQPTEVKKVPIHKNFLTCEQCYCYICDKPALQCAMWTVTEVCHCNSHKNNDYWRGLRDVKLLGFLRYFDITLCEMDTRFREAEVMLGSFTVELAKEYSFFMRSSVVYTHNYTPVYECVWTFLNKADGQEDKAAAVMRLGAAMRFMAHTQPAGPSISHCPKASATTAKVLLIERVIAAVQQQMVLADFDHVFSGKLNCFYQVKIPLPSPLMWRLKMRYWNDPLLVSVLRGQNVSGVQGKGAKKDTLYEELPVILLRVQYLQKHYRYRELYRYLRVVLCAGVSSAELTRFQEVTDFIPLYMCWTAEFAEAISQFSTSSRRCPTLRLTPFFFRLYLHILETGTAPVLDTELPTQATLATAKWEKIIGAEPQLHTRLVVLSLRVMKIQKAIYSDSSCWEALLSMVNTPRDTPVPLEKPSALYLQDARMMVRHELNKGLHMDNICVPAALVAMYPRQGLLLMMTEALAMRITNSLLVPAIPVVNTFKDNEWAFQWLCDSLMSYSPDAYLSFMKGLLQELQSASIPTAAVLHDATNAVCACGKICKSNKGLRTHQRSSGCKDGDVSGTAQTSAANASSQWLLPHPLSYYYPSLSVNINMTH